MGDEPKCDECHFDLNGHHKWWCKNGHIAALRAENQRLKEEVARLKEEWRRGDDILSAVLAALRAELEAARNTPRVPNCANCESSNRTVERLAKILLAEWAQDEYGPDTLIEAAEECVRAAKDRLRDEEE